MRKGYGSTLLSHSTKFSCGAELVAEESEKQSVANENWPEPLGVYLGDTVTRYYAELWCNGMDYSDNVWAIECINHEIIVSLIVVATSLTEDWYHFSLADRRPMFYAMLLSRRDFKLGYPPDQSPYNDTIWPFFHVGDERRRFGLLYLDYVYFKHASQPKVEFFVNQDFLPIERRKIV